MPSYNIQAILTYKNTLYNKQGKLSIMAIAKLSKVFSFFQKTNASEKILKAVSQGKMPNIYMKNLQSVKNDAVRNTLTNYTSLFVKKSSEQAQMLKSQIDDITYKLNLCEDATIKSKAEKLILNAQNKSQTETYNLITKAELLLDSANSGKYSTLFNARTPIGTYDNWSRREISRSRRNSTRY